MVDQPLDTPTVLAAINATSRGFPVEVVDKPNTTVRLRTHPGCDACCSRRACHFCAGTASGLYMAKFRGHTYFACAAHRKAMEDSIKSDPRESLPNPRAYPVSTLLS